MNWIIQDAMTWTALKNNCEPLIAELKKLNCNYSLCGIIPDEKLITGIENIDLSLPTFFYGSTLLPVFAKPLNCYPGVFWEDNWFNPNYWIQNCNNMLNQNIEIKTIFELKNNWVNIPTFIKPMDIKTFTGHVIEKEDLEWWEKEYSHLPDDLKICCSPLQNIEREWRFWIINDKIITGSQYKKYGCLAINSPIEDKIYREAKNLADDWIPNSTIVMDIAELRDGSFKIVEFNSINSSGFYHADISKIILEVKKVYDK
jgi:hypothetical protein